MLNGKLYWISHQFFCEIHHPQDSTEEEKNIKYQELRQKHSSEITGIKKKTEKEIAVIDTYSIGRK